MNTCSWKVLINPGGEPVANYHCNNDACVLRADLKERKNMNLYQLHPGLPRFSMNTCYFPTVIVRYNECERC